MRVLVACEFSGRVRDAFLALGHDAWSCDTEPTEVPGPHIQDDVLLHLEDGWDLMIAHPPCTYLSRAGAQYWNQRTWLGYEAMTFVRTLFDAPITRVAVENPIGRLNKMWRYPSQIIQPYMFGEPWSKATCLWLRGLPPLMAQHVMVVTPGVDHTTRQSGAWRRVVPGTDFFAPRTAKARSRTFPGVAAAMAQQWGSEDWHL